MISFEGKVIAVTGGAQGIGFATAKLLVSLGAKVSIADIQEEGLQAAAKQIKAECGGKGDVMTMVTDVRKREAVDKWIAATVKWGGSLDGGANLAGVVGRFEDRTIKDFEEDDFDWVMSVNLKGVLHCMRAELNAMTPGGGGSIVNAASISGLLGIGSDAAYIASKHGVVGLTRAAARQCGASVRVNAVAPGIVDTPMVAKSFATRGDIPTSHTALDRRGKPEEIADLIAFLLSDRSSFITGAIYSIDGGWNC